MGPATVTFIAAVQGNEIEGIGLLAVIGAAVNAVLSAAYMFAMEASSASFQSFQYYFDPTHPNVAMADPANVSLFTGDSLTALVVAVIALVVALAAHHDVHHGRDPVHAVLAGFGEGSARDLPALR